MLYQYTATDQSSASVRGSIDAPSLDQARQILIDRGMEVVELKEARQVHSESKATETAPMLHTVFAFEGTDADGVIRRGTLQAESKYEAFERLRESQNLTLTMLSPVGVTPQYHDRDLENWQMRDKKIEKRTEQKVAPAPQPAQPPKKLGFTSTLPNQQQVQINTPRPVEHQEKSYAPILLTVRLYAGWLLAWYAVFVSFGYYSHYRSLPISIPFVEAFYTSSTMFGVIVATFLFLLLSTLLGKDSSSKGKSFLFIGIGILLYVGIYFALSIS